MLDTNACQVPFGPHFFRGGERCDCGALTAPVFLSREAYDKLTAERDALALALGEHRAALDGQCTCLCVNCQVGAFETPESCEWCQERDRILAGPDPAARGAALLAAAVRLVDEGLPVYEMNGDYRDCPWCGPVIALDTHAADCPWPPFVMAYRRLRAGHGGGA